MKMPIKFIKGSINQLEEIVRVNHNIFNGMYENEPYSLGEYQKRLSNKKPVIYLAKDNGKVVGDSVAFEKEGVFYVWIIGVLTEYRQKGIGARLLELNEQYAGRNGFKSVTAKVYDVSPEMQKLLVKRGYQAIKEEKSGTNEKYNVKHFRFNLI